MTDATNLRSRPAAAGIIGLAVEHQLAASAGCHRAHLHRDAYPHYVGALGELETARLLAGLGAGWHVLHAVPAGSRGRDIDHLVIGPGGVFAINTKSHRGAEIRVGDDVVWMGKDRHPYQRDARRAADDAALRLSTRVGASIDVEAVVAVHGARLVRSRRGSGPVTARVADAQQLVGLLIGGPERLTPAQVEHLVTIAAMPSLWSGRASEDIERDVREFALLRSAVGTPSGRSTCGSVGVGSNGHATNRGLNRALGCLAIVVAIPIGLAIVGGALSLFNAVIQGQIAP